MSVYPPIHSQRLSIIYISTHIHQKQHLLKMKLLQLQIFFIFLKFRICYLTYIFPNNVDKSGIMICYISIFSSYHDSNLICNVSRLNVAWKRMVTMIDRSNYLCKRLHVVHIIELSYPNTSRFLHITSQ